MIIYYWTEKVYFFGFCISHGNWIFTNLNDAKKSEDLVLKEISPFFRKFCHVKWV